MNKSSIFTKVLFSILSIFFFTAFALSQLEFQMIPSLIAGVSCGVIFAALLFGSEYLFSTSSLKQFNVLSLGLLFGYVLAQAFLLTFRGLTDLASYAISEKAAVLLTGTVYLYCIYLGITITRRASEEIYIGLPFFKLKPSLQKKKDLVLDISILTDSRIIDLISSGLLDNQMVLPRFIMKSVYEMAESQNDTIKSKARRALEVVKKMEELPTLGLRYNDNDFPEIKDLPAKVVRLARFLDGNILTADMNQIEQSSVEGVRIINIHTLAKGLKPLTQSGEYIQIKVQRYGKEARQGIGYLDDGTMVVINGGAEFIGETIKVKVLSVKHTSSGRMIFCNAEEEEGSELSPSAYESEQQPSLAKNYFAL